MLLPGHNLPCRQDSQIVPWIRSSILTEEAHMQNWLVVWHIFLFSHILGKSSQLTLIFFRGVGQPPTRERREMLPVLKCSLTLIFSAGHLSSGHFGSQKMSDTSSQCPPPGWRATRNLSQRMVRLCQKPLSFKGKTWLCNEVMLNLFCSGASFSMERHIAHIQPWPSSFKQYCIHPRVLLHSNVSLYYCMVFNQMVHSLVKQALYILAPMLSLRNTTIGQKSNLLLKDSILSQYCPPSRNSATPLTELCTAVSFSNHSII